MDFRGGRMTGPPPTHAFRPSRGGRGNNHISQHPNQHHQGQPRLFSPAMNAQWTAQSPINQHNAQQDGLSYPPPHYTTDQSYASNFAYHTTMPSPELINTTPQPQGFTSFPQPVFIPQHPQMYMDPAVYHSPPVVTPPPMVAHPSVEANPNKKFQFNSNHNVTHCANCNHKNILAETEFIKRDEKIELLEKENHVFRKQMESMTAENTALRSKLEALMMQLQKKESSASTEPQENVDAEVADKADDFATESENIVDDAKKPNVAQKALSPDAAEFNPSLKEAATPLTTTAATTPVTTTATTPEVPVVSALGGSDEDVDSTSVRGNEAGTQVEEALFDDAAPEEVSEVLSTPQDEATFHPAESKEEESTSQAQNTNWCDEVDKVNAQEDSFKEPKVEMRTEVAEDEWDDNAPPPTAPVAPNPYNWRENPQPQTGYQSHDSNFRPYYNRRHNNRGGAGGRGRDGQQPLGFGRGKVTRNDQEQQHQHQENYRQNAPHYNHNKGYQNHQNTARFSKSREDNYDYYQKGDHNRPRYDNRHNQNQRYGDKDKPEDGYQSHMRENSPRDRETHTAERPGAFKHEERDTYNSENRVEKFGSNAWGNRGRGTRDNTDSRDMKEYQAQGAMQKKDNKFNPNSHDSRETSRQKNSINHSQGNHPNKGYPRQYTPKSDIPDIVNEIGGDLFTAPNDFSLAHCVAQDFRMGSGIAVKFKEEFKRVGELLDQNVQVGGCAHLQDNGRYIFYLVTKEVSNGKPTINTLRDSLKAMKEKCLTFKVKKLAMPRIGCGLDKLDWHRVKFAINEIFQGTDIEIRIYDFNVERVSEAEGNKVDGKSLKIQYHPKPLVDIATETALLFLGTEDGYMDPTAVSLNQKHRFEQRYKTAQKSVGTIVFFDMSKTDWVVCLVVAKSKKDKILFTNVEKCCCLLSQFLRKNQFVYAGIEYPQGWSEDRLFFEKILSVFRACLNKSIELWACFPDREKDVLNIIKERDARDRAIANKK